MNSQYAPVLRAVQTKQWKS